MTNRSAEATITVNGTALTAAQSMTIRVALENFSMDLTSNGLGHDVLGRSITRGYLARIREIQQLLYGGVG